jgi:hypothetical protein
MLRVRHPEPCLHANAAQSPVPHAPSPLPSHPRLFAFRGRSAAEHDHSLHRRPWLGRHRPVWRGEAENAEPRPHGAGRLNLVSFCAASACRVSRAQHMTGWYHFQGSVQRVCPSVAVLPLRPRRSGALLGDNESSTRSRAGGGRVAISLRRDERKACAGREDFRSLGALQPAGLLAHPSEQDGFAALNRR